MIVLLALPVLAAVVLAHRYLQRYAPSNVLIRRVRASRPRPSTVLMLVILTCVLLPTTKLTASVAEEGAPGWLHAVVLILAWDTIRIALLTVFCAGRGVGQLIASPAGALRVGGSNRVKA